MKRIAIVSPRFHSKILDGGEIYTRRLASHLKKFADVTVLTTKSIHKESWKNEIENELEENNDLKINRFSVESNINYSKFNDLIQSLYSEKNPKNKDLYRWIRLFGPYSPGLYTYLKKNVDRYNLFFFIGYNNALTYFGLPIVKQKAILIPLLHKEAMLRFKIFDKIYALPQMILLNSYGEKQIVKERFSSLPPLFTLGIGLELPLLKEKKSSIKIDGPYCISIGRLSRFKGTWELIDNFVRFKSSNKIDLNLVLIGENIDYTEVPKRNDIIYFKKVNEVQKISLLAKASFLINPSYFESLSLTLLESWMTKTPVLVNGLCHTLKYQVIQSNGGLFYENYKEFEAMSLWLNSHHLGRRILGRNGYIWAKKNYSNPVIEKKIEILIKAFSQTYEL